VNGIIKLLIFGAGSGGNKVTDKLDINNTKVIGFIDNDKNKIGKKINGIDILMPEDITSCNYDFIIIASIYEQEIYSQLIDLGISKKKIISLYYLKQKQGTKFFKGILTRHKIKSSKLRYILKKDEFCGIIKDYTLINIMICSILQKRF